MNFAPSPNRSLDATRLSRAGNPGGQGLGCIL
jgi:hypothetical protein